MCAVPGRIDNRFSCSLKGDGSFQCQPEQGSGQDYSFAAIGVVAGIGTWLRGLVGSDPASSSGNPIQGAQRFSSSPEIAIDPPAPGPQSKSQIKFSEMRETASGSDCTSVNEYLDGLQFRDRDGSWQPFTDEMKTRLRPGVEAALEGELSLNSYLNGLQFTDADGRQRPISDELKQELRVELHMRLRKEVMAELRSVNDAPAGNGTSGKAASQNGGYLTMRIESHLRAILREKGLLDPLKHGYTAEELGYRYSPADEAVLLDKIQDRRRNNPDLDKFYSYADFVEAVRYRYALSLQMARDNNDPRSPDELREQTAKETCELMQMLSTRENFSEQPRMADVSDEFLFDPDRAMDGAREQDLDSERKFFRSRTGYSFDGVDPLVRKAVEQRFMEVYEGNLGAPRLDDASGLWVRDGHMAAIATSRATIEAEFGHLIARQVMLPTPTLESALGAWQGQIDAPGLHETPISSGRLEALQPGAESMEAGACTMIGAAPAEPHPPALDSFSVLNPASFIESSEINPTDARLMSEPKFVSDFSIIMDGMDTNPRFRALDGDKKFAVVRDIALGLYVHSNGSYLGSSVSAHRVDTQVVQSALATNGLDIQYTPERGILIPAGTNEKVAEGRLSLEGRLSQPQFGAPFAQLNGSSRNLADIIMLRWQSMPETTRAQFGGTAEFVPDSFISATMLGINVGAVTDADVISIHTQRSDIRQKAHDAAMRSMEKSSYSAELREKIASRYADHAFQDYDRSVVQGVDSSIVFGNNAVTEAQIGAVWYEVSVYDFIKTSERYSGLKPEAREALAGDAAREAFLDRLSDPGTDLVYGVNHMAVEGIIARVRPQRSANASAGGVREGLVAPGEGNGKERKESTELPRLPGMPVIIPDGPARKAVGAYHPAGEAVEGEGAPRRVPRPKPRAIP